MDKMIITEEVDNDNAEDKYKFRKGIIKITE